MSVLAAKSPPRRRGACPGLSSPMPTGDGLLVRLLPTGTIPLDAFTALCAAAHEYGNGVIEITARGSIQIRGLTAGSAPRFADTIAALGIAADGIPVLTNPLTGIDPTEIFDAGALGRDLRNQLAVNFLSTRLAPKISIAIDGGGALGLDAVSADVRLDVETDNDGRSLRIGLGGDRASAVALGTVTTANAGEAVVRLLEVVSRRGGSARTRDIVKTEGTTPFHTAIADLMSANTSRASCPGSRGEAIGLHRLHDGSFACGIGLAFGHANASALEQLTQAARSAGAVGLRTAPGRVLLAIGTRPTEAATFIAAAERLGFITSPDDPRRRVIACTGAPGCASAYMPARAIAPEIAEAAASTLADGETIHISGCAKGCAHPGPAALAIVGTPEGCALIANGSTRDTPFAVVAANRLSEAIASAMREGRHV
jgi:precorrin-3B synthase